MVKELQLSNGEFALVDDEDYDFLARHTWARIGRYGYPAIAVQKPDGSKKWFIYLHRIVTQFYMKVDHINHNVLDARKENLRPMTKQLNGWNANKMNRASGKRKCTSRFKGVCYAPRKNGKPRWRAQIMYVAQGEPKSTGKMLYLGYFDDEDDAARAYNAKAKELRGEWALLNNVPEKAA